MNEKGLIKKEVFSLSHIKRVLILCLIIPLISLFLTIIIFGIVSLHIFGQSEGFKYSKNYSFKEYDHLPQNWGMAQAKNGLIYIANHGGVLEFDGVSWRIFNIPHTTVRSLALDEAGNIFIGGINEIGYLSPSTGGELIYQSLVIHLDMSIKKFPMYGIPISPRRESISEPQNSCFAGVLGN